MYDKQLVLLSYAYQVMIRYIGIKNASEANQLNKDFLHEAQKAKKRDAARKNIVAIAMGCVVAGSATFVYLYTDLKWQIIVAIFGVIAFLAEFLIFKLTAEGEVENEERGKPIAYQFFVATKGREVLNTNIVADEKGDKCALHLEVKSRSGIIATECIDGFELVNDPETEDTVVDLDNGIIYVPVERSEQVCSEEGSEHGCSEQECSEEV